MKPRLLCRLSIHPLVEQMEAVPRYGSATAYPCPTIEQGTRTCHLCGHQHYYEKWVDLDAGYQPEDRWLVERGGEFKYARRARKWIVLGLAIVLISIASKFFCPAHGSGHGHSHGLQRPTPMPKDL